MRSLPDGVELHALSWSFEGEEAMLDQLEDGGAWECLGQAMPDGWAFAWLDDGDIGRDQLGRGTMINRSVCVLDCGMGDAA